jgi:hypothetical protein
MYRTLCAYLPAVARMLQRKYGLSHRTVLISALLRPSAAHFMDYIHTPLLAALGDHKVSGQISEFRLLLTLLGSALGTAAFCVTKCAA